jgi:hypothetical protein
MEDKGTIFASVDTSKPAIRGRGKAGHRRRRPSGSVVAHLVGSEQGAFSRGPRRLPSPTASRPGDGALTVEARAPAARAAREDVGVVEEPIEQRGDGGGVAEHLAPVPRRAGSR